MFNRKDISEKYYKNWKLKHDVFKVNRDEITNDFLVDFYKEYRLRLMDFVNELDSYVPNILLKWILIKILDKVEVIKGVY